MYKEIVDGKVCAWAAVLRMCVKKFYGTFIKVFIVCVYNSVVGNSCYDDDETKYVVITNKRIKQNKNHWVEFYISDKITENSGETQ